MVLKSEFSMFSSFCRLCATTSELLIPVFGKEGDRERIGWKIRKCLPILVEENDDKPKQVCLPCISKLDVCYELIELSLAADAKFDNFLQSSNTIQDIIPSDGQTLQEPQDEKSLQAENDSNQIFSDVSSIPQEQKSAEIAVSSQQSVSVATKEHSQAMVDQPADTSEALSWPVAEATASGLLRQDGSALALSPQGSVIVLGKVQPDGSTRDECQDILLMVELKYNKDGAMPEIQAQQVISHLQPQPQPIKARIINYVPDSTGESAAMSSTGLPSSATHSVGTNTGAYVHETYVTQDDDNVRIAYSTADTISKGDTLTFITDGQHLGGNAQPVSQVSFANTTVTPTLTKEGTLSFVTTAAGVVPDSHIISFAPESDIPRTPLQDFSDDCPTPKIEFVDGGSTVDPKLAELVYESENVTAEVKQPADDSRKPFECSECGKRFMRRTNLRTHLATHTAERPHTCETCGKSFAVRWDLTLHARLHTGVYTCEICGKAFSVRGKLDRHRRVHSGERPFSCGQCGKAFSDKHNLEAHIRTHSDIRPYSCQQCGHTFRSRSHLRAHRRVHSQDAPFVCHLCGKPFKWKANLNLHIKVHSGERFKCECCGREFARPGDLVRHRRGHEGVRPHTCTVCSKSYTDRAGLNKHMKSHAEHRPYVCDVCNKSFHFQWYLNTHKKMHETQNNKKFVCSTCGKEFPKRVSLIGHEKFHLAEQRNPGSEGPTEEAALHRNAAQTSAAPVAVPLMVTAMVDDSGI